MSKKVAIVGAGLAGLSAGIYLQKNGIESEIFELADWPGGVCTSWVRQGYRFDGCIHWMVGTKPGDSINDYYLEVGALTPETQIYNPDYVQTEIDGKLLQIPLKLEPFKAFLLEIAPEDKEALLPFLRDLDSISHSKMPAKSPENFSDALKMMKESWGYISAMGKTIKFPISKFLERFKNPTLKKIILSLMPGDFSLSALYMMLGTRLGDNAGYPMGGSLALIKRMVTKYEGLGGQIHLRSKVEKINLSNGKAVGIQVLGQSLPFDGVIASGDGYDLLNRLLDGKYEHPQLSKMLINSAVFTPLCVISFGLDKNFDIPYSIDYQIPEGLQVTPDYSCHGFNLRSFDFDPSAAPAGCSSVMAMFESPLEYWQQLRTNDYAQYKEKKAHLAQDLINKINGRIPGFASAVKVIDVSTPATYVRVANLYKASFEGFLPTPTAIKTRFSQTIPGINNLTICGQWVTAGGGICTAITTANDAVKLLLKELK